MKLNIRLTPIGAYSRAKNFARNLLRPSKAPFGIMLAALALPLCLISGCTATGGSSSSLQREVDSLRREVADLKASERLSDMRGGGGDANSEINRLRTDVQRLSSSVEAPDGGGLSLREQLDGLNARLDQVEKRAGLSGSANGRAAYEPPPGGTYQPPRPPANAYQPPASSGTPVTGNATAPLPPAAATGPYDEGKSLYDQKQYRAAIGRFKSYLSAEPKGGNAAAAQFYIGESLYAQQQYEESILEYQKVVQGFPKSSQVPHSLLKQGQAFQAIGDKDSAKLLYQKVARDFPKSPAASVANSRMKTI